MPTYQYACTTCGEQVEAVQRFSDDPLTVCPACGGALRKMFLPVGIVFKGSGFYRTDSRQAAAAGANGHGEKSGGDKSGRAKEPAESGSSSSGQGSSDTGSSTPDAKKPAGTKSSPAVGAGSPAH